MFPKVSVPVPLMDSAPPLVLLEMGLLIEMLPAPPRLSVWLFTSKVVPVKASVPPAFAEITVTSASRKTSPEKVFVPAVFVPLIVFVPAEPERTLIRLATVVPPAALMMLTSASMLPPVSPRRMTLPFAEPPSANCSLPALTKVSPV